MTPKYEVFSQNALNRTAELNRRPVVTGLLEPLGQILNYYKYSTTDIVLVSIPFGLEHEIHLRASAIQRYYRTIEEFSELPNVTHLNAIHEPLFKDCRNYFDFRHLNERGRKHLTAFLAKELKKPSS